MTVHRRWWKFGHVSFAVRPRHIFVSRKDRAQVNSQLVEILVSTTGKYLKRGILTFVWVLLWA